MDGNFDRGGRMARAIRDFDWSGTSMGPASTWPLSLRSVIEMMLHQRQPICLFWGDDLNLLYNDAYMPMLGAKEAGALGKPFKAIWAEVWDDLRPFVDKALSGEGTYAEDMRLVMTRNGFEEETFFTFSYSPLFDDEGIIRGLINVAVETTQTVLLQRSQKTLRRELVHRVKNSLAVTSSVVSATLRQADSLQDARETISRRISALADAQNLLDGDADGAAVESVVRSALQAWMDGEDRISVSGPHVRISAQQAIGLSLATYELATNAMKYGALSGPAGRIAIAWEQPARNRFRFVWRESDGPPVAAPGRTGFGSRLTNRIVPAYFSGEARTELHPQGLRYELTGMLA